MQNQNHPPYLHNQLQFPCNNFLLNITNSPVTVVTNHNKLLLNSSIEFCYRKFNKNIYIFKRGFFFFFSKWIPTSFFFKSNLSSYLGMAMGQGGAKRWGLRPRLTWFYLALSPPLDASRSPAPPRKTLFLLIFLTPSTIFFF